MWPQGARTSSPAWFRPSDVLPEGWGVSDSRWVPWSGASGLLPYFPPASPAALLLSRLTLALTIPPHNTKLLWPPPWNGSLPSSYSALFGLLVIALITACLGLKVTHVCVFLSFPVSWEPLENRVAWIYLSCPFSPSNVP